MKSTGSASTPTWLRPPRAIVAMLAVIALVVVGYCLTLWPEWSSNPDLSHGLFAPLVFFLLLRESVRQGPQRWLPARPWSGPLAATLFLASFAAFALAGLFAATLAWSHAVVLFLLAASIVSLLGGSLVILADDRVRVLPCNWISLTAILLWLLVAPIPDGTYARLTLGLQSWVTGNVMNVLHFFGVPARQHGNVIELARTTVGVEEACSGVRSLLSCIYAGFFFAAWQVRRPLRRLSLILLAPLLALGMNLLRSLGLTLLANQGTDISGTWHDATGFAILAITAAVLAGLAILLESPRPPETAEACVRPPSRPRFALGAFWATAVLAAGLGTFFLAHSRVNPSHPTEAPDLTRLMPAASAGWAVSESRDLYQFAGILQTSHLFERTYRSQAPAGGLTQVTVYVAYWPPGSSSVSRVASHTPDACWPGAGWNSHTAGTDRRQQLAIPGLALAPAEYRFFRTAQGREQHVWFWHVFDGRVIDYRDPYSIPALLQIAWQYGFKREGSQYFVRLSSNRPWPELVEAPLMQEILTGISRTGLAP